MAKYDKWKQDKKRKEIFDYLTNGHNRSELIKYMGIDRSTFYQWIKEHNEFKELIEEAYKTRDEIICDKLEEKLEEKCLLFDGDLKAIMYLLERLRPEKWGKKEPAFKDNKE